MADIELVIKIPEEEYIKISNSDPSYADDFSIYYAIKNGTPLPKGHWIHRTQDGGCFWEECSVCHTERAFSTKYCPDCGTYMYADIRTEAPAIIEAVKAESEDKCKNCKYYRNPDYTRCHECEAERNDKK